MSFLKRPQCQYHKTGTEAFLYADQMVFVGRGSVPAGLERRIMVDMTP